MENVSAAIVEGWVQEPAIRNASLNDLSRKIADQYSGKPMFLFGTLGNYPTGGYGDLVRRNVTEYINRQNRCVSIFLSQGAIPPERTEARRKLPPTSPHHLNEEGYRRHLESRKHPDEKDLENAAKWLEGALDELQRV